MINKISYTKYLQKFNIFIFYCLIFISFDCLARAGGGGNGGNSGGGGSSGGGGGIAIVFYLIRAILSLPFPLNIIVILIIVYIAYLYFKNQKQSSTYNTLSTVNSRYNNDEDTADLTLDIPNFNQSEFYAKVKSAFFQIQDAWQMQNLKAVRQFISDGVYQRFESQFIMMRSLEQRNLVSDVKIGGLKIVSVENDGNFHILHVSISASNIDYFDSKKFTQLNSGGYEEYTEYWTFVKKINSTSTANIFENENCPNCGDSIHNKLGEVSKCPSCGTQINNGDYDWVLSEITQPEEFASNYNQLKTRQKFYNRLKNSGYSSSEFSPQYIEDKASNAYLQLKIACALVDQKRIARFCSNDYLEKSKNKCVTPYLYNRLFLKDVSLINIIDDKSSILAVLSTICVSQKVKITNNKLEIINTTPVTNTEYIVLSRSKKISTNKYSAMAHNCSSCGAPVENSLQLTCNFCGNSLNDNSKDWIVENLLSHDEYQNFKQENQNGLNSNKQENQLVDNNFDVRDYALNNMMVVACADGVIQDEEREFLLLTAKQLGYNSKKISELFEQVKSSNLALKMPKDDKKRAKIIKLMNKIANADGDFNDKEKAVIAEAEAMA